MTKWNRVDTDSKNKSAVFTHCISFTGPLQPWFCLIYRYQISDYTQKNRCKYSQEISTFLLAHHGCLDGCYCEYCKSSFPTQHEPLNSSLCYGNANKSFCQNIWTPNSSVLFNHNDAIILFVTKCWIPNHPIFLSQGWFALGIECPIHNNYQLQMRPFFKLKKLYWMSFLGLNFQNINSFSHQNDCCTWPGN